MIIKTSQHARIRLKERFNNIPSFSGSLDDNKLKFIENLTHRQSKVYKYNHLTHPIYLLIGTKTEIPFIITVLTPKMYRSWKTRHQLMKGIKSFTKPFGFNHNTRYKIARNISNFLIPFVKFPYIRILLCKIFGHLKEGKSRRGDGQKCCYFCFEILNKKGAI